MPKGGGGPAWMPRVNSVGTTPSARNRLFSAASLPWPSSKRKTTMLMPRMVSITQGKVRRGAPGSSLSGIIRFVGYGTAFVERGLQVPAYVLAALVSPARGRKTRKNPGPLEGGGADSANPGGRGGSERAASLRA